MLRDTLALQQARLERALTDILQRALRNVSRFVSVDDLERMLARHDVFGLHDLAAPLRQLLAPAVAVLNRMVAVAAQEAFKNLVRRPTLRFSLAMTNPYALAAARAQAATLVTEVTESTRVAIREVIGRAFAEGISPRETAELVRPLIGLTTRQSVGVLRDIEEAEAAGATRAEALSAALADIDTLRRERALLIARTEIIDASTQGRLAAWQAAIERGYLTDGAQKRWVTTNDDRLCRFCRAMHNQTVPLRAPFHGGKFGAVDGPPLHPACRCALALVPVQRAA